MTEHSGEKIKPATIAYPEAPSLDAAYDALALLSKPGAETVRIASETLRGVGTAGNGARIAIKSIEEGPPPSGNSALIDAIGKIYTVVTRQIAYHEREASRLREALKPFATMAPPRQPAAPDSVPLEDGVRQLLAIADRLGIEGEQGT